MLEQRGGSDLWVQAPLQPLQDNLEMQTYETFEKDLQKYTQYEEAVLEALLDRVPEQEASTRETILMVCGTAPFVPIAEARKGSLNGDIGT